MIKIMMSAGEVSGDAHGAALSKELLKINKSLHLFGMGGEKMGRAGVDIKVDIAARGTIGIVEIFKHLPFILSALFKAKRLLKKERPDVLVLIDFQGFNMALASYAKKIGIKTAYYIPPQEWLWGSEKGVKKVAATIDKIISIFEDEAKIYSEAGGNVDYVGNPNLDTAKPALSKEEFCKMYGVNPSFPVVGLFPGSRYQEVKSLLPVMLRASSKIKAAIPNAQFILSASNKSFENDIKRSISSQGLKPHTIYNRNYDIMAASNIIIAASGTTITEAAIIGTPAVMVYKISAMSYFIGKYILKISLPYFSMINLIAKKGIIPELVQENATPEKIFEKAYEFLVNAEKVKQIKNGYRQVIAKLGSPGAVRRAAEAVYSELKGKI